MIALEDLQQQLSADVLLLYISQVRFYLRLRKLSPGSLQYSDFPPMIN